ncbi:MAG TPA: hypothetical protein VGO51_12510, partial [Burkholderiaceae bacterium]|nr:hypothetical protein [Burkholderiaceae bacterium]
MSGNVENVSAIISLRTTSGYSGQFVVRLILRSVRPVAHVLKPAHARQINRHRRLVRRLPQFAFIGLCIFLTTGCATISPRNVLPEASAGQIELEGYHNIRFWGDASAREIEAIVMADAPKSGIRS